MRTNGFVLAAAGANAAVWTTALWLLLCENDPRPHRAPQSEPPIQREREHLPQFVAVPTYVEPIDTGADCEAPPEHVCVFGQVDVRALSDDLRARLPLAMLHGRVWSESGRVSDADTAPLTADVSCEALEMTADPIASLNERDDEDDATTTGASFVIDAAGRFKVVLAAGRHKLVAESEDDGETPGVFAVSSLITVDGTTPARIEATLPLEATVDLQGLVLANRTTQAIADARVAFIDKVDSRRARACAFTDVDGRFSATRLPAQTTILVAADGFAPLRREPTFVPTDLVLRLDRAPLLLGAIGKDADGVCRHRRVMAVVDDHHHRSARVDEHCAFIFYGLEPAARVRLQAAIVRGEPTGMPVELTIPANGDPPPVCLAPPCEPPAVVVAWLQPRIGRVPPLDDDDSDEGAAAEVLQIDRERWEWTLDEVPMFVTSDPLPPGQRGATVVRQSGGPVPSIRSLEVSLHPGFNEFSVPLP